MLKKTLVGLIGENSSGWARCLFSGAWFAAAAVIPVAYYLIRFGDVLPILGGSLLLTTLFPIVLSSLMGLLLGSNILDPAETKNAFKAAVLGFSVAALSFLFLFTIPAIPAVFTSVDIFGTIITFAIFFLYGLLIAGWLAAITGAAAGLLLYLLRRRIADN